MLCNALTEPLSWTPPLNFFFILESAFHRTIYQQDVLMQASLFCYKIRLVVISIREAIIFKTTDLYTRVLVINVKRNHGIQDTTMETYNIETVSKQRRHQQFIRFSFGCLS